MFREQRVRCQSNVGWHGREHDSTIASTSYSSVQLLMACLPSELLGLERRLSGFNYDDSTATMQAPALSAPLAFDWNADPELTASLACNAQTN